MGICRREPSELIAAVVLLLLSTGAARADELIQIPTADRASTATVGYRHRLDGPQEGYGTFLLPAGSAYELAFRYYNNEDGRHRLEGGGQLQLLPDGFVTPGIALGVWDLSNSSSWGRRGFLVLTKGLEPGQLGIPRGLKRVQLTLGTGTGRFSGVLAGVRADLPSRVTLIAEHDSRRLNLGVWFSPIKPLTLKGEIQNGNPYFGAEFRIGL